VQHRFAINDIDEAYTGAYRDWEEWEREIDILALHGYNEIFMPVGAEAVYLKTFKEFGYASEELRNWFPQPARFSFFLLQCMSGSPYPPTEQLIEKRARLGRQIADRMRSLGIMPVLAGYYGTVPPNFKERVSADYPDVHVVPQGKWAGRNLRPDWLNPTTAPFAAVAKSFYRNSDELLGPSGMFKMDFLHEGGESGGVDVGAAAKAVQSALQEAYPGAIWAMIGWRQNPTPETLKAVDPRHILIVDGLSDRHPPAQRDQQTQFGSASWAFGTIWNFGGHEKLGANLAFWNDAYWHWKKHPASTLKGIALLPEASDNNPVALAFFSELAWHESKQDLKEWFANWAHARYGGEDANAVRAWQALRVSAYSMLPCDEPPPVPGRACWTQPHDGLYESQPTLTNRNAYSVGPPYLRYDPGAFSEALPALLAVAPELRQSSAYRWDVMDVARQVMSNESHLLLPLLMKAYRSGNATEFDRLSRTWLERILLMDRLMSTSEKTLLGRWIEEARAWATTSGEADELAYDNLTLITSWWWSKPPALKDYAHREWAGLLGDYYHGRWKMFFDSLRAERVQGTEPETIDWAGHTLTWARSNVKGGKFPTQPSGDVHQVASEVLREVFSRTHGDQAR
jgi:hypothetical protein